MYSKWDRWNTVDISIEKNRKTRLLFDSLQHDCSFLRILCLLALVGNDPEEQLNWKAGLLEHRTRLDQLCNDKELKY